MIQSILRGVVLAALLAGPVFAGDMPFAEAKSAASAAGKPLLIDFYATW